jgi:hypothetical protein
MDEPLGIVMDLATSNWGGRYACVKSWSRLDVPHLSPFPLLEFGAQDGLPADKKSPLHAGGWWVCE